jgi:imidazole glycerol-phosphate synthase subunit HisH
MIGVLDYGAGNVGSVIRAFGHVGFECSPVVTECELKRCSHLVLPGVGAFDYCMDALASSGLLHELIARVVKDKIPLLGVCVGAQMLGRSSEEGSRKGLNLIDMECIRFPKWPNLKIPHVGWARLHQASATTNTFSTQKILSGRFYFTHSYYMVPKYTENVLFTSTHELHFCSAVYKENIIGVQFHPEKSHRTGLEFLRVFASNEIY